MLEWCVYSDILFFQNSRIYDDFTIFVAVAIFTHNVFMVLTFIYLILAGSFFAYLLSSDCNYRFGVVNFWIFLGILVNVLFIVSYLIEL